MEKVINEEFDFYIGQPVTTSWGFGTVQEIIPETCNRVSIKVKHTKGSPIFDSNNVRTVENKIHQWMN